MNYVISSGQVSSGIVLTNGTMLVLSGGTITNTKSNTKVNGDFIYMSGFAIDTDVYHGWMRVNGFVSRTNVYTSGLLTISSGASAQDTTLSGGHMIVRQNGKADNTTISSGGSMFISKTGCAANNTVMAEGICNVAGKIASTTIHSGGSVIVKKGGTANSTTINFGGIMDASSGGTAADTTVNSGGSMTVSSGGKANNASINDDGYLFVLSGGTANSVTLSTLGRMYVSSGGFAANINPLNGGAFWVDGYVSHTVLSGRNPEAHGDLSDLFLSSGGSADDIEIGDGGNLDMGCAQASKAVVLSGGRILISSGGILSDVIISSGGSMRVSSGGTANSTTVNSGGWMYVSSGGTANSTIVNSGGLYVSPGGTANETTVNSGGYMPVSSGGTASTTTVNSGGSMAVRSGGKVNSTTVNSGGNMTVSSGGMIFGTMQIANGAVVSAYTGATIDFTVAEQETPATALINNWSLISGGANADYTLTVKADQAYNTYTLAEGAADFANTITVKTTDDTTLGTLAVDETKTLGGFCYTLSKDSSVLSLTIEGNTTKSDVDGNGISDVMFQYTGGDYQIGFWMNGTNTWQGQGIAQDPDFKLIGAYDMNVDGKADAVMIGDATLFGHHLIYTGYYLDGSSEWKSLGVLDNPGNIEWKNAVGNLTGNAGCNSLVWHAPELGALGVWTDGTANWVSLGSGYNENWVMQGCGDFDGNGKDEVLFTYEGNLYSIDIDCNFAAIGQGVNGWEVRAIGDFSGDGQDDIVLFHTETGSVMKFENGTTYQNLGQLDASDWFIAGCGDYNNDQKDDLLVRQNSSGMLGYYESGDLSKWVELGRGIDSNWTVVA